MMNRFKEILKTKIEDETAAFTILGTMILTFAILIGTCEYIKSTKLSEVNSNLNLSQIEQEDKFISDNFNDINNIVNEIDEEKAKEENEKEYEKLKKENKISPEADKYYIKVNYGAQVVNIYKKNSKGEYEPYKAMVCSTGTYTPSGGVYRTLAKGNWWPLYGDVYGQYSTHIVGGILFHSVPYLESGNKSSLEYWAYDQLGQRVSMGCVRLTVKDAKWIYENCPVGTQVEFYSSSNPGPFGKPSARKISNAPKNVRGWDPTDPDSRNPWPKYLKALESNKDEEKENNKDENKNVIEKDPVVNEVKNEMINETTNDIANDVVNDITNDVTNEIEYNTLNEIDNSDSNNVINSIEDDKENLEQNVYVSEIAI